MKSRVVAIEVDKVQTFLFESIHAHRQESQMNTGTLRTIVGSSDLISNDLPKTVGLNGENGLFTGNIEDTLLDCSGMCVFTSGLPENEIRERLKQLYATYYVRFGGQLLVKYWHGEMEIGTDDDSLSAIRRAKNELRKKECLNDILAENKELLFEFQKIETKPERSGRDGSTSYSMFAENINQLILNEKPSGKGQDPDEALDENATSRFRIAVIKADFDGMGELFKGVQSYEEYKTVSRILSEKICLRSLGCRTKTQQKRTPRFKLFPLYAAGDDIYFAVPVTQLLEGLQLCKELCQEINQKLREKWNHAPPLSLSIGVDFTFNREPIRYYNKRVQHQLDLAKGYKDKDCPIPMIKIALNDCVFYDFVIVNDEKQEVPGYLQALPFWGHFRHTVKLLRGVVFQSAQEEGIELRHRLYGLLQKISDPQICSSTVKYSNAVLYHLLPRHLEHPDSLMSKAELLIIEKLLEQVTEFVKEKKEKILCFSENRRNTLKRYLQLMLLFVDLRFIEQSGQATWEQVQIWEKTVQSSFSQDRIRRAVFNRPLRCLYEENLMNQIPGEPKVKEELRAVFVKPDSYLPEGMDQPVKIYRTLRISDSLFLRLKNDKRAGPTVITRMLENANSRTFKEISELEAKCKEMHKAPPNLYFDSQKAKSDLMNAFRQNGAYTLWNKDYIDSLLVLYQYRELLIRFKGIYPSEEDNEPAKRSQKS